MDQYEIAIVGFQAGHLRALQKDFSGSSTWWDYMWAEFHCLKEQFIEQWLNLYYNDVDPGATPLDTANGHIKQSRDAEQVHLTGPFFPCQTAEEMEE